MTPEYIQVCVPEKEEQLIPRSDVDKLVAALRFISDFKYMENTKGLSSDDIVIKCIYNSEKTITEFEEKYGDGK